MIRYITSLLALVMILCAGRAEAAKIVEDTFTDGGRTNGVDPFDMDWFVGFATISTSIVNDSVIGGGNALAVDIPSFSGTPNHWILGQFPATTLGSNIGDKIRLNFDVRFNAPLSLDDRPNFRYGLFNSNSTPVIGDDFSNTGEAGNDSGYYMGIRVDTSNIGEVGILRDDVSPLGGAGLTGLFFIA